jgi:S-methylmethionine-dependent homocysteine/selenocysteine methylase
MRKSKHTIIFYLSILSHGVFLNNNHREFNNHGQLIAPYIRSYIDAGIKYIGGCCHVNPDQIRTIRDIIDEYTS